MLPSRPEVNLDRYRDQIDPDTPGGRLAAALEAGSAAAGGKAGDAAEAAKRALGEDGALFAEELDFTAPTIRTCRDFTSLMATTTSTLKL